MEIKTISSGSKGNCYIVDDGKSKLMLECGVPFKKIMKGIQFKLSEIEACLVTHQHRDHAHSVKDLMQLGVKVAGPADVLESTGSKVTTNFTTLRPGWKFYLPGWTVMAIEAYHDVPCLAYYFKSEHTKEKVFYVTDSCYIAEQVAGVNYLIAECNYDPDSMDHNLEAGEINKSVRDRIIRSHLGLENLVFMIQRNDWKESLRQVYLIHLSDYNANWQKCKAAIEKVADCQVILPEIERS